jgi:hypothetical protein
MLVVSDRCGERIEERLHSCAVGIRQDQRERVVGARLHGGVDRAASNRAQEVALAAPGRYFLAPELR